MFTGIVQALGAIRSLRQLEGGVRLRIEAGALAMADVALGDSIAVQGVCLTVAELEESSFEADVSSATLSCTAGLDRVGEVNLEKALRLSDRLGGHLVTGHVDGVGEVTRFDAVAESWLLRVRAPLDLAKYFARKGSVAVDGVSLTVNEAEGAEFAVNLIPHTMQMTTLKDLHVGARVNLEIDLIARYVERMLAVNPAA
jgi:riboflavin synthase